MEGAPAPGGFAPELAGQGAMPYAFEFGGRIAGPVAEAATGDTDRAVRRAAAELLVKLPGIRNDRSLAGPLVQLLADEDPGVRMLAEQALGALAYNARDAVPALALAAEKDPSAPVRAAALNALAGVGFRARAAMPAATAALRDPSADVRVAAAAALGAMQPSISPDQARQQVTQLAAQLWNASHAPGEGTIAATAQACDAILRIDTEPAHVFKAFESITPQTDTVDAWLQRLRGDKVAQPLGAEVAELIEAGRAGGPGK
jgi:hypothetical protein